MHQVLDHVNPHTTPYVHQWGTRNPYVQTAANFRAPHTKQKNLRTAKLWIFLTNQFF